MTQSITQRFELLGLTNAIVSQGWKRYRSGGLSLDETLMLTVEGLVGALDQALATLTRRMQEEAPVLQVKTDVRGCQVYKEECKEHGFVHGAEAEELRKGLEALIEDHPDRRWTDKVQNLLDRVDARDSLAYLEAQDDTPDEEPSCNCDGPDKEQK